MKVVFVNFSSVWFNGQLHKGIINYVHTMYKDVICDSNNKVMDYLGLKFLYAIKIVTINVN
jgi:hypothetical protein